MKDRKGIARLALRTGTPIVPAYSFGNTAALCPPSRPESGDPPKGMTHVKQRPGGRQRKSSFNLRGVGVCYCSFVSLSRVSEFEFRRHTECQQVEDRMAEPLQLVLYLLCWCIFTNIGLERQDLSFDRSPFRTPRTPCLQNLNPCKIGKCDINWCTWAARLHTGRFDMYI